MRNKETCVFHYYGGKVKRLRVLEEVNSTAVRFLPSQHFQLQLTINLAVSEGKDEGTLPLSTFHTRVYPTRCVTIASSSQQNFVFILSKQSKIKSSDDLWTV